MRGTLVAIAASLVVWLAAPGTAHAQLVLQNDGFTTAGQVFVQSGFVAGEIGASRFVAPSAGRSLQAVTLYFGGATSQQTITLRIYDDTAVAMAPGAELFSGDFQITGSDSALTAIDLSGMGIVVPQTFRVGIEFQHAGAPSIARDNDGNIAADKNYIRADLGAGSQWFRSQTLGLTGDWIIRATVSNGGGPVDAGVVDGPIVVPDANTGLPDATTGLPDASGTSPDASSSGGCQGNGDCAIGSYCNTADNSCTFDCRNDGDCGSGECNSLGQCVVGDDAGGCCSTGTSGGVAGAIGLGAAVALLLGRRRRRR